MLDSLTFSRDFIDESDALIDTFDFISEKKLFLHAPTGQKAKALDELKHPPQWFDCTRVNSLSHWVVSHFEVRLLRFFARRDDEDVCPKMAVQLRETYAEIWRGLAEPKQLEIMQKAVNSLDRFSPLCFVDNDLEGAGARSAVDKARNLTAEERLLKLLLGLQKTKEVERKSLKATLLEKMLQKRSEKGPTAFVYTSVACNVRDALRPENFFMNLLVEQLEALYIRTVVIERLADEENEAKKKKKKRKKNKKGANKEGIVQVESVKPEPVASSELKEVSKSDLAIEKTGRENLKQEESDDSEILANPFDAAEEVDIELGLKSKPVELQSLGNKPEKRSSVFGPADYHMKRNSIPEEGYSDDGSGEENSEKVFDDESISLRPTNSRSYLHQQNDLFKESKNSHFPNKNNRNPSKMETRSLAEINFAENANLKIGKLRPFYGRLKPSNENDRTSTSHKKSEQRGRGSHFSDASDQIDELKSPAPILKEERKEISQRSPSVYESPKQTSKLHMIKDNPTFTFEAKKNGSVKSPKKDDLKIKKPKRTSSTNSPSKAISLAGKHKFLDQQEDFKLNGSMSDQSAKALLLTNKIKNDLLWSPQNKSSGKKKVSVSPDVKVKVDEPASSILKQDRVILQSENVLDEASVHSVLDYTEASNDFSDANEANQPDSHRSNNAEGQKKKPKLPKLRKIEKGDSMKDRSSTFASTKMVATAAAKFEPKVRSIPYASTQVQSTLATKPLSKWIPQNSSSLQKSQVVKQIAEPKLAKARETAPAKISTTNSGKAPKVQKEPNQVVVKQQQQTKEEVKAQIKTISHWKDDQEVVLQPLPDVIDNLNMTNSYYDPNSSVKGEGRYKTNSFTGPTTFDKPYKPYNANNGNWQSRSNRFSRDGAASDYQPKNELSANHEKLKLNHLDYTKEPTMTRSQVQEEPKGDDSQSAPKRRSLKFRKFSGSKQYHPKEFDLESFQQQSTPNYMTQSFNPHELYGQNTPLSSAEQFYSPSAAQNSIPQSLPSNDEAAGKNVLYSALANILSENVRHTAGELDRFSKALEQPRKIVKSRVDDIIMRSFNNDAIRVKAYGSCETGLLTPFSDMDLAIQGCQLIDRIQAVQMLEIVQHNLQLCPFVTKTQAIFTAAVPVLKFECDPSIEYEGQESSSRSTSIKVDVIVELMEEYNIANTAIRTTDYVWKCSEFYESFHANVLVLKYALNCNNFSNSYSGGLNSYGLSLLYVAFLELNAWEKNTDTGALLFAFLRFLSTTFDPNTQAVFLGERFG